jgi:2-keto-4-pentenoate hydratase/2-oxohepta-3-ene-1,7-dioic acid hydratase in catechol pathway
VRLGCTFNGEAIQDGRTSDIRFSIPEILEYLGAHVRLEPGDLIATGTPVRVPTPPGPERHLQPGDVVTCWIEGIGDLTTTIA